MTFNRTLGAGGYDVSISGGRTAGLVKSLGSIGYEVTESPVSGFYGSAEAVLVAGVSGLGQVVTASLAPGFTATGWQWYRVAAGGSRPGTAITGATSAAYTQVSADVVTGTNIYPLAVGLAYLPAGITAGAAAPAPAPAPAPSPAPAPAPAPADTRPRTFIAPNTAATSGQQGYLDAATKFGSNGGKAGSFSITTTSGNYGWFACLSSAGAPVFTDVASGFTGGWQKVGSAFTDANGAAWDFWRQDFPNANPTAANWTVA